MYNRSEVVNQLKQKYFQDFNLLNKFLIENGKPSPDLDILRIVKILNQKFI